MTTATQTGAAAKQTSNPDLKEGEVIVKSNPRQDKIDAFTARVEKARVDDLNAAIANDPDLAATQERMETQQRESRAAAEAEGLLEPLEAVDGAASVEPLNPPEEPVIDPLPAELADDPLKDFLVMEDGKPMFKAKIDGQQMLIPLEQAKRQIQIGTAAEIRMQQATRIRQDAEERAQKVTASEAALEQRIQREVSAPEVVPAPAAVPAQPDLSSEDLLTQSRDILSTMFSGTEEEAAVKLARTLDQLNRVPPAPVVAPAVDENAIVEKTAKVVVSTINVDNRKKDVRQGYTQFQKDYPEIMNDVNLYNMADGMTDKIEKEYPDWDISKVMDEAGKRTRAWVKSLAPGSEDLKDPKPPDLSIDMQTNDSTPNNRQERKQGLVRMPAAAVGAVHKGSNVIEDEKPQTPQEALAETRKARGQPD